MILCKFMEPDQLNTLNNLKIILKIYPLYFLKNLEPKLE